MNGSVLRLDHRILNMQRDTFHKSCLIFHCILIMQGVLDHLSLSLLLHVDTLTWNNCWRAKYTRMFPGLFPSPQQYILEILHRHPKLSWQQHFGNVQVWSLDMPWHGVRAVLEGCVGADLDAP